jgi:2-polyprenyl-3-methyl-5-hydroxy-6-metoxy-1,4-benzoquinol methylase
MICPRCGARYSTHEAEPRGAIAKQRRAFITSTPTQTTAQPGELKALKRRQQAAWSSGDYALIGATLQIIAEKLCEAVDLRGGQRVLDVAAASGNAALAAARRFCSVVATDYVPSLLERGRLRALAEQLPVESVQGTPKSCRFQTPASTPCSRRWV